MPASRPDRLRLRRVRTGCLTVMAATAVLAGCAAPPTSTAHTPNDGALPIASGPRDLTLKMGTLLPLSGTLATLGPPQIAGTRLAAKDIAASSLGLSVRLIERDSGDTSTSTATVSTTDLLSQGVTAVVGASASSVTKIVIDQITGAGVVQISPSNTSPELTAWKDHDMYFRTAPSDVLQGEVLGNEIANAGVATLGIIYLNDAYGVGLVDNLSASFQSTGGNVVSTQSFNEGDTTFSSQVAAIVAQRPDAVAVISFDQARTIIPALIAAGVMAKQLYLVDGNAKDYSSAFTPGLIDGAHATIPGVDVTTLGDFTQRLHGVDPELVDTSYAAEAYDAVTLVALAAYAANSVSGPDIAKYLRQVSGGTGHGVKVHSFEEGAKLLAQGKQIDYDGLSGGIRFDEHGDPTETSIGVFTAQHDNTWRRTGDR
ncbi:MAG TPA: ABC transporter substrate-binding protein [Microbacteriaceae bacterium]|nr:ABC transporter substrate-binding protein [Microbacteriaceae bacterium]